MKVSALFETPKMSPIEALKHRIKTLGMYANDPSATEHEKATAAKLKVELEAKLKELGGTMNHSYMNPWADIFNGGSPPPEWQESPSPKHPEDGGDKETFYRGKLEQLRKKRQHYRMAAGLGDTEASYEWQAIDRQIESILRTHFPEEYEKILKKREESNKRGYEYRDKKRKEKTEEKKAKVEEAKLKTFKNAAIGHEAVLKKMFEILKNRPIGRQSDSRYAQQYPSMAKSTWTLRKAMSKSKYIGSMLSYFPEMSMQAIREAWSSLDEADRNEFKSVIESIHDQRTTGNYYDFDGYTPAQKAKILNALKPYETSEQRSARAKAVGDEVKARNAIRKEKLRVAREREAQRRRDRMPKLGDS